MQKMPPHWIDRFHGSHVPVASRPVERHALRRSVQDEQFVDMLRAFRRSGGLIRDRHLASLLVSRSASNIGLVARWIVEGKVVHFNWQQDTWFPMFQFVGPGMAPRTGVSGVLRELRGVCDPSDIAQWFAQPSPALGHATPADSMELDPERLVHAARCDA